VLCRSVRTLALHSEKARGCEPHLPTGRPVGVVFRGNRQVPPVGKRASEGEWQKRKRQNKWTMGEHRHRIRWQPAAWQSAFGGEKSVYANCANFREAETGWKPVLLFGDPGDFNDGEVKMSVRRWRQGCRRVWRGHCPDEREGPVPQWP